MILVTGGAGFIGSHIVEALLSAGRRVRILDSLLAHDAPPHYLSIEAELIRGDLRDPDVVRRAVGGVEGVCHQAGKVGLGTQFTDVTDYVAHNDCGTAVLLRELAACRFTGRLVLASSMVVYGEGGYRCPHHGHVRPAPRRIVDLRAGRFDPTCPRCRSELTPVAIAEDARLDPRNVYAATKVHQEHLCFAFQRETGVPVSALRYHNVYGPRMPRGTPYAGVAALFASELATGRAPRVFEDGRQLRDFVHVRDVADANVLALTAPNPITGTFNISSGEPRSVGELAAVLAAAVPGAPAPLITGEFRHGDVRHIFASPDRAEQELRFRATRPFAASIHELAQSSWARPADDSKQPHARTRISWRR